MSRSWLTLDTTLLNEARTPASFAQEALDFTTGDARGFAAQGVAGASVPHRKALSSNARGTAEQWIKEGKYALNWTRLSCHRFVADQVRLWPFAPAYPPTAEPTL